MRRSVHSRCFPCGLRILLVEHTGTYYSSIRAGSSLNPQFAFCFRFCIMLMRAPPARNQGVERGASPQGCPSSNRTLASVPSSQLPSHLAISSSQRQPLPWSWLDLRMHFRRLPPPTLPSGTHVTISAYPDLPPSTRNNG